MGVVFWGMGRAGLPGVSDSGQAGGFRSIVTMKIGRPGELPLLPPPTPFSAAYYEIVKEHFRIDDDGKSQDRSRGCLAGYFRGKERVGAGDDDFSRSRLRVVACGLLPFAGCGASGGHACCWVAGPPSPVGLRGASPVLARAGCLLTPFGWGAAGACGRRALGRTSTGDGRARSGCRGQG